jgi:hypothetical protein
MTIPVARNINFNYESVCSSSLLSRKDIEDARIAMFWWKKMAGVIIFSVGVAGLCLGRISQLYERRGSSKRCRNV